MADFSDDNRENRSRRRVQQLKRMRRQRIIFAVAIAVLILLVIVIIVARARGSSDISQQTGMDAQALDGKAATAAVLVTTPEIPPADESPATTAAAPVPPAEPLVADRLAGKIIAIDPGHASNPDMGEEPIGPGSDATKVKDPGGTSGAATGTPEYVVTLAISENLKAILESEGAKVVMTREGDTFNGGNRERAQIANDAGADLFVRIHCDGSTNPSKSGSSTLYPASTQGWTDDIFDSSRQAAEKVQAAMVRNLGVADQGAVERDDMTGFNWADVPAILPEVGFMSNPDEDVKLNSAEYQQQVAGALARGIEDFLAGS